MSPDESLSSERLLAASIHSAQANEAFTEAVLLLRDESRLCFHHCTSERWAKAIGGSPSEPEDAGIAGKVVGTIKMFRLNSKHLDIQFEDGSRWDRPVQDLTSSQ